MILRWLTCLLLAIIGAGEAQALAKPPAKRVTPRTLRPVGLADAPTSVTLPTPVSLPTPVTLAADVTAAAASAVAEKPAWIQWLGFSTDGQRLAWRQGPHWTTILVGSPIEIVRLDPRGQVSAHLHQTASPADALKQRRIRLTPQVRWQRKTPRDTLLESSDGRVFAVVVRSGKPGFAAVLEKRRGSYDPMVRWPIRGPAARVDVAAYEDWSHRWMAIVVQADSDELADAQVVVVPLARNVRQTPTLLIESPTPPSP